MKKIIGGIFLLTLGLIFVFTGSGKGADAGR